MIRIVKHHERIKKEDNTLFYVLELQSGIMMVQSQSTGKFYATAKKTTIPTTFDKETCKALIGTEMQGSIIKEECEPFEHTIKDTGEVILLSHKFVYSPEEDVQPNSSATILASANQSVEQVIGDIFEQQPSNVLEPA